MVQYMKYFISSSRFFNTSHTPMNWSVALPLGKLNVSLLTLYQSSLPPSRYLSFVKPLNHALRLDELRFWCSGINLSNTSIQQCLGFLSIHFSVVPGRFRLKILRIRKWRFSSYNAAGINFWMDWYQPSTKFVDAYIR